MPSEMKVAPPESISGDGMDISQTASTPRALLMIIDFEFLFVSFVSWNLPNLIFDLNVVVPSGLMNFVCEYVCEYVCECCL